MKQLLLELNFDLTQFISDLSFRDPLQTVLTICILIVGVFLRDHIRYRNRFEKLFDSVVELKVKVAEISGSLSPRS